MTFAALLSAHWGVSLLAAAVLSIAIFVLSARFVRAFVYDALIVNMTAKWYRAVLTRLPRDCHLLDVGIGTGLALIRNNDLVEQKRLRITGIDYDQDYVRRCDRVFQQHGLSKQQASVHYASVYDWKGGPYNAAYFSGSLMIMPDQVGALKHVASLLEPSSRIYVTQTFEGKPNRLMEVVKPILKFLLTIDFGRITYEKDFTDTVKKANLRIVEQEVLVQSSRRTSKLFVLEPNK